MYEYKTKLSNQNKVLIWYSVLIGYMYKYQYKIVLKIVLIVKSEQAYNYEKKI